MEKDDKIIYWDLFISGAEEAYDGKVVCASYVWFMYAKLMRMYESHRARTCIFILVERLLSKVLVIRSRICSQYPRRPREVDCLREIIDYTSILYIQLWCRPAKCEERGCARAMSGLKANLDIDDCSWISVGDGDILRGREMCELYSLWMEVTNSCSSWSQGMSNRQSKQF